MTHSRLSIAVALAAVALLCTACPSSGVYRSAKTQEPGVSDLGLSWNATRIASAEVTENESGESEKSEDSIVIPKILPEVSFHVGIADNVEAGGRVDVSSGLLELDAKYRFLQADGLHLAVQPAAGYQSLFFVEGVRLTLPVIATYELTPFFSVNVFGYGQYFNVSPTSEDSDDDIGYELNGVNVGGGGGFTFEGETFYFTPMIEYSKSVSDFTVKSEGQTESASADLTFVVVSLNLGFYLGKEKQQLDRQDKKLDDINDKLDRALEK